ncbi:MAG: NUDIX hydrolase [Ruminococcus sp.]|nr:NUDIX hydrolase [Ruminococcus sp.]
MNQYDQLKWTVNSKKKVLSTPIFDVYEQAETAATGIKGDYLAIDAPDWVMTIPVYEGKFVMVRQWRHAAERLSVEFPGGIADEGEDPAKTAYRELLEETGFKAGRITHLGTVSPNAAIFSNRFHIYLAEDLIPTGETSLDDDELVSCELIPIDEVIASYGEKDYSHALMGTALFFYLRRLYDNQ